MQTPARRFCTKCRHLPAEVAANQNEPLCRQCLVSGMLSRFRNVIRLQQLIQPGDKVLAAASGGAASQAMLYCLLQIQNTNPERPDRGKVSFNLAVAHVDGDALLAEGRNVSSSGACNGHATVQSSNSAATWTSAETAINSLLRSHGPANQSPCHVLSLPFPSISPDRGQADASQQASMDPTSLSDSRHEQRDQLLREYARLQGCNRIAMGYSSTRLAILTIAEAAKGFGADIPASVQYLGPREQDASRPVIMRPMRDITAKDAAFLCHFLKLHVAAPSGSQKPSNPAASHRDINLLAMEFVNGLQATMPSGASAILRTASKLQ
ncbi:hypothetical protein WJX74_007286 [Apatococcus lobatus]|uniref:Cytoplasmic tRNA 2-thiolation protein 2 n=1 Tax=Apatococcus lobatus TaxID=904363 RepID=A0AAW1S3E4_9CHLO